MTAALKAPFPYMGGLLIGGAAPVASCGAYLCFSIFGVLPPAAGFSDFLLMLFGKLFALMGFRQLLSMFVSQRFALFLFAYTPLGFFANLSAPSGRGYLSARFFRMMPTRAHGLKVFSHFWRRVVRLAISFDFLDGFWRPLLPSIRRCDPSYMLRGEFTPTLLLGHYAPGFFAKSVSNNALPPGGCIAQIGPVRNKVLYPSALCLAPITSSFFKFNQQRPNAKPRKLIQPIGLMGFLFLRLVNVIAQALIRLIGPAHIAHTSRSWIGQGVNSPFTR